MRRRFIIILLFLVVGAIVNVAVAWCAMLWLPTNPNAYQLRRVTHSPAQWTVTVTQAGFGKTLIKHAVTLQTEEERVVAEEYEILAGWPMRSVACSGKGVKHIERNGGGWNLYPTANDMYGGIAFESGVLAGARFQVLPYSPRLVGFAINTIFCAAVLWMMLAMPIALRRRRRIKRGLCAACAYPIGTSPVCTECGKAVQTQKAEIL